MAKKSKYAGKFVVAFDTLCEGEQCFKDEDNAPTLYNSYRVAYKEMFDDNLSILESHADSGQLKDLNEGVTNKMVKEMAKIYKSGNLKAMEKFMEENPNCNDMDSWVVSAEEFILGRKAIFTRIGR